MLANLECNPRGKVKKKRKKKTLANAVSALLPGPPRSQPRLLSYPRLVRLLWRGEEERGKKTERTTEEKKGEKKERQRRRRGRNQGSRWLQSPQQPARVEERQLLDRWWCAGSPLGSRSLAAGWPALGSLSQLAKLLEMSAVAGGGRPPGIPWPRGCPPPVSLALCGAPTSRPGLGQLKGPARADFVRRRPPRAGDDLHPPPEPALPQPSRSVAPSVAQLRPHAPLASPRHRPARRLVAASSPGCLPGRQTSF